MLPVETDDSRGWVVLTEEIPVGSRMFVGIVGWLDFCETAMFFCGFDETRTNRHLHPSVRRVVDHEPEDVQEGGKGGGTWAGWGFH